MLLTHLDSELLFIIWVSLKFIRLSTLTFAGVGIPLGLQLVQAFFPVSRNRRCLGNLEGICITGL